MTREGDRLGRAFWVQSGIYAEVLHENEKKGIDVSSQQEGTARSERMGTHNDDFSGDARTQYDPPCVGFFVLLETEHAYTDKSKKEKNQIKCGGNDKGREKHAPMPISDHVGAPSRSVVNLNTFALTVYVVSSSSSPSPSAP
jgi:hypothetical protein